MKQYVLFLFLLMSVVCYGQLKDIEEIRMKVEMQKYLEQKKFIEHSLDLSLHSIHFKRKTKEPWIDEYHLHMVKGSQYLKNNDSIQSIRSFLSADSVILKHPEILENDSVKRVHSYVLLRLGLAYLDTHTLEGYEKATYYFDRSESLGYKEAYIFSNISRSGSYMIQRIKNMKDSKPLQKDSVSSNSE